MGPTEDDESFAACIGNLGQLGVVFERLGPIEGDAACGAAHPLKVSAVGSIEVRPAAEMQCPVARSLALWIDRVVTPLTALYLQERLAALIVGTDYQCRERRGGASDMISEHAFANAIDVHGLALESGDAMLVAVRAGEAEPERALQAGIRGGACAFFTTVLGPETNDAHSDHLHLDMAERRGGYRVCE